MILFDNDTGYQQFHVLVMMRCFETKPHPAFISVCIFQILFLVLTLFTKKTAFPKDSANMAEM